MRKLKITEMGRMTVDEFKMSEKMPLVVVLDNVRSMYNVGSIFRTSDAFRVSAVYLCGITSTPPHAEIHKTALGAEDSVEWKYFEKTEDAVAMLKEQGYTVLAIEQCEGSTMLQDFKYEKERHQQTKRASFILQLITSTLYPMAFLKSDLQMSHFKNSVSDKSQALKLLSERLHSAKVDDSIFVPLKTNFLRFIPEKTLYFILQFVIACMGSLKPFAEANKLQFTPDIRQLSNFKKFISELILFISKIAFSAQIAPRNSRPRR